MLTKLHGPTEMLRGVRTNIKHYIQEFQFKKPTKNLNFGTMNQSAASIQLCSQSNQARAENESLAGNISYLDLTVLPFKFCIFFLEFGIELCTNVKRISWISFSQISTLLFVIDCRIFDENQTPKPIKYALKNYFWYILLKHESFKALREAKFCKRFLLINFLVIIPTFFFCDFDFC